VLAAQAVLLEHHEVVREAEELRLHAFGGGAAGPGFALFEFVFRFIEDLLPAGFDF